MMNNRLFIIYHSSFIIYHSSFQTIYTMKTIEVVVKERLNYEKLFSQKLDVLKTQGNYRYFLEIERSAADFPVFRYTDAQGNRAEAINFCSNDYLGQTTHPAVQAAAKAAIDQAGTGSGGTRNISGTTTYHRALEKATAQLVKKEAVLVFNSAYLANQTALTTLGRHLKGCIFISDEENHASMIEGLRASKCQKHVFRHNDMIHLEAILKDLPEDAPKVIAFESVYSMSGTVAPMQEIIEIAKKYHALTYCDEVHAVGMYGTNGAGFVEQMGFTSEIDILNGTFAKSYGVIGGFLAGSAVAMDFIRSHAEGYIFTSSLPPATCAAITESIQIVNNNPQIIQRFHENVRLFRTMLAQNLIEFSGHASHITRINIGNSSRCKIIADNLLKTHGIYLQPINFPTVPHGQACLRIVVNAKHTPEQMKKLVEALKNVL
jgi:5-aminolevulinate synthase